MIKLPAEPFKVTYVDDNDPFVSNALKDRKHFEPCWCGSGKKYKKCHMLREQEKPYSIGKLQNLQRKVFWKKRGCMHPSASPGVCRGKVIDSHTIQRKGPLERITNKTNHVMHFEANSTDGSVDIAPIGWRKASIFPGFCSYHDSTLFDPIEKGGFSGKHEHCVLHAFRNICNEYYRKNALIESLEFQRTCLDRGFNLDRQISTQNSCIKSIAGQNKSVDEMRNIRNKFEAAIIQGNYDAFDSKCYFFKGSLDVVSSSVFQCEWDFLGNKLIDMWDLTIDADMLSHSIVDTEDGGAIVFVWLKGAKDANAVIDSFDNLPDDEKCDIFIQYCFVNCENTFFSEQWWNSLSQKQQAIIKRYANTLYYEGGKYSANIDKLVDWVII